MAQADVNKKGFRVYKKALFFGDRKLFNLKSNSFREVFIKIVWAFVLLIMVLTMVLGGLTMMMSRSTPQNVQTIDINSLLKK